MEYGTLGTMGTMGVKLKNWGIEELIFGTAGTVGTLGADWGCWVHDYWGFKMLYTDSFPVAVAR